jgi:hypothetical protein
MTLVAQCVLATIAIWLAMTQNSISMLLSNEHAALMNFYDGLGVFLPQKNPKIPCAIFFFHFLISQDATRRHAHDLMFLQIALDHCHVATDTLCNCAFCGGDLRFLVFSVFSCHFFFLLNFCPSPVGGCAFSFKFV